MLSPQGDGSCFTCCGAGFLPPKAALVLGSHLLPLLQIPLLLLETPGGGGGFGVGAGAEGCWGLSVAFQAG